MLIIQSTYGDVTLNSNQAHQLYKQLKKSQNSIDVTNSQLSRIIRDNLDKNQRKHISLIYDQKVPKSIDYFTQLNKSKLLLMEQWNKLYDQKTSISHEILEKEMTNIMNDIQNLDSTINNEILEYITYYFNNTTNELVNYILEQYEKCNNQSSLKHRIINKLSFFKSKSKYQKLKQA